MTVERIQQLIADFRSDPDVCCLMCGCSDLAGTVVVEWEDDDFEGAAEFGMRPDKAVVFALCDECWRRPRDEALEMLSLRMVPIHARN